MICEKPWKPVGGSELPCGKCKPCKINKPNIWTTRLLLEQTSHDDTAWITLTYNDENLPENSELNKNDYKIFLKALRKSVHPIKIRYYLCGEYGTDNNRPHYHIVLYGIGYNYAGLAEYNKRNHLNRYPEPVKKLLDLWGKGNIHFVEPSPALMTYVCSHITKDIPHDDIHKKAPEFHSMSGGLGKNAMHAITSWLSTEEGVKYYKQANDVPAVVRIDKKMRPIGKYLRNIIRRQLYLEEKQPDNAIRIRGLIELEKKLRLGPEHKEPQRQKDKHKARQILSLNKQRKSL